MAKINPPVARAPMPPQQRPAQPQQPAQRVQSSPQPSQQPVNRVAPQQPAQQPPAQHAAPAQPAAPQQRDVNGQGPIQQTADGQQSEAQLRAEKARKAREEKLARLVPHPATRDEQGNAVLLAEVPTDFDADVHQTLKKADFAHPSVYLQFKAQEYRRLADKLEREAEEARNKPTRGAGQASRLRKMQERYNALRSVLEAQGIDVDAILREQGLLNEQIEQVEQQEFAQEQPQEV